MFGAPSERCGGWLQTDDYSVVKMNPSGLVVSSVFFIDQNL